VSAQLREKTLVLGRTIAALEKQSATEARRAADLIGRSSFLKQKAKECVAMATAFESLLLLILSPPLVPTLHVENGANG
jgi:hypothetical protein